MMDSFVLRFSTEQHIEMSKRRVHYDEIRI